MAVVVELGTLEVWERSDPGWNARGRKRCARRMQGSDWVQVRSVGCFRNARDVVLLALGRRASRGRVESVTRLLRSSPASLSSGHALACSCTAWLIHQRIGSMRGRRPLDRKQGNTKCRPCISYHRPHVSRGTKCRWLIATTGSQSGGVACILSENTQAANVAFLFSDRSTRSPAPQLNVPLHRRVCQTRANAAACSSAKLRCHHWEMFRAHRNCPNFRRLHESTRLS